MNRNRAVDARNTRTIPAAQYKAALDNFLRALGVDDETAFEVVVTPDRAVVKQVNYTRQDSGVMSGDFWNDVIEGRDVNEDLL